MTDFGIDREGKYPGYFFCHNYKMYDGALIHCNQKKRLDTHKNIKQLILTLFIKQRRERQQFWNSLV